jgi:hypothetical protein
MDRKDVEGVREFMVLLMVLLDSEYTVFANNGGVVQEQKLSYHDLAHANL